MFVTGDVDIPDEVLDAQNEGSLVVFVGAGASYDKPSGLPLFPALTSEIARGAQRDISSREIRNEPDVVLGKLDEDGIPVHQRVRSIITSADSKPNRLHHALAGLFRSKSDIRVVTTNYDTHLESALRTRWNEVETFRAPALPLGNDFAGLVYLHGSTSQDPKHLVVTDADFGRAYLNEAWATRFLHDLFATSTVLFVGYGHNDRVMTYLARGLSREHQNRFVMAPRKMDNEILWQSLRLKPIPYTTRRGSHPHLNLTEAVESWSARSRMGLLDHAIRIREMTETNPPNDPTQHSYLSRALGDADQVRILTNHATGSEWVDWVLQDQSVQVFVQKNERLTLAQQILASWLAREFMLNPDQILETGRFFDSNLIQTLCPYLAQEAHRCQRSNPSMVSKWIPILLSSSQHNSNNVFDYLLSDCRWPEDRTNALLLFEWLTVPTASLGPWPRIELRGDDYWLTHTWAKYFQPNLQALSTSLIYLLVSHLETAHFLLFFARREGMVWNSLSYDRSAIEVHEQNQHAHSGLNFVIDACRDTLDVLMQSNLEIAHGLIESFQGSDIPLFRRFAIYGWTQRRDVSSSDRLTWLLGENLVWDFSAKHEVFRMVNLNLSTVSPEIKQELLSEVLKGPPLPEGADIDVAVINYAIFNFLFWMVESDGDFQGAADALKLAQARNPEFAPRENPDFDHWMSGGFVGPRWPWTPERIVQLMPGDFLVDISKYQDAVFNGIDPAWSDVCGLVSEVVRRSPDWGVRLGLQLSEDDNWDSYLWNAIVQGWSVGQLSGSEWKSALDLILSHHEVASIRDSVAGLLMNASREKQDEMPSDLLENAGRLSALLWSLNNSEVDEIDRVDWIQNAFNHWSGKIVQFLLYRISREWRDDKEHWKGLKPEFRESLMESITGNGTKHAFARSILAGELNFLGGADFAWATQHLIPLFDWNRNPIEANQSWNGFLTVGQWNQSTLPLLLPHYVESVEQLRSAPESQRDQLFNHLAFIALYGDVELRRPPEWLSRALALADPDGLARWSQKFGRLLKTAPKELVETSFQRWILRYWEERIEGIPTVLSNDEVGEMFQWAIYGGSHFPAIVKLLAAGPATEIHTHYGYLHDFKESELVDEYPSESAEFLLLYLRSSSGPLFDADLVEPMIRSIKSRASVEVGRDVLPQICSEAIRLGLPSAIDWLE